MLILCWNISTHETWPNHQQAVEQITVAYGAAVWSRTVILLTNLGKQLSDRVVKEVDSITHLLKNLGSVPAVAIEYHPLMSAADGELMNRALTKCAFGERFRATLACNLRGGNTVETATNKVTLV